MASCQPRNSFKERNVDFADSQKRTLGLCDGAGLFTNIALLLSDAYAYIDLHNQLNSTFSGLNRVDRRDYPAMAIRESLLNAIVHRDDSYSASTLVSIYGDRMEIVAIGGLFQGVALEDIKLVLSVCRNKKLADIFYRLTFIEAYGTGLRKIQNA